MAKVKDILIRIIYAVFRLLPIKSNSVLLISYYGEQYSGAPKYIGKYLESNTDLKVVWAFVQPEKYSGVCNNAVRFGHLDYYITLATAGTVITNYRMTEMFHKRSKQKYIQTWHSSLRLKQIEKDAEDTLPANYIKMAKKDSTQIDYLLAGSKKSRDIFKNAFWYNGEIVNTGTPQCDIFFQNSEDISNKVFEYFNIPAGNHIAMYAPTFRKNHATDVYDLNTKMLLESLKKRFGGDWYLLMRLHPHLVNSVNCFEYSEHVLAATSYDDVQELLCVTDFLISDYSAIMFDYSVLRRPCMLYTPDLIEYISIDRKLYFDIKELPFESFENQTELLNAICKFDEKQYNIKLSKFLDNIGSFDDGNACARVVNLIKRGEDKK